MFGDKLPLGRERAIETLIDLEASGAHYRATRISDEIVPHSLKNRPNLITRSALVEQAHALSEYEIDSSEKYRDVFDFEETRRISAPDKTTRDRVLRHHAKIVKCKNNNTENPLPSLLVTKLKGLFGPELYEKVLAQISSTEESNIECTNKGSHGEYNVEAILGNAATKGDLNGLLLGTLSVLTGCILEDDTSHEPDLSKGKTSSESTSHKFECTQGPDDIPVLQVGAILSLLQQGDSCKGPFSMDESILEYLQKSSAVYEERIEIQKSRLLTKTQTEDGSNKDNPPKPDEAETGLASDSPILVVPLALTEDSGDAVLIESDPEDHQERAEGQENNDSSVAEVGEGKENEAVDAIVSDDDDDDDEDDDDDDDGDGDDEDGHLATSALSAAVFDRIISAVAGEDESLDGVERAALRLATGGVLGEDSSDSESTNDHDSGHLDHYSPHNDAPHDESNEDSSSEEHDHDMVEGNHEGAHRIEENDSILRQALALSLAEHNSELASGNLADEDTNQQEDREEEERPMTPPHSEISCKSQDSCDEPLPDLPAPPSYYPYCVAGEIDEDIGDKLDPCLDPASLSRFGSVPASFAMVHLLHNALSTVLDHAATRNKGKEKSKQEFKFNPIPGGIGSSLFGSELELVSSADSDSKDDNNDTSVSSVSLQMLVAAFLLMFESRAEAIEQLREAILDEQRNAQGEEEAYPDRDINDTPLSDDDEEDNALPMTLNYPERDTPAASLVSPSSQTDLENKGMTRKAAAAGFDAAMRMKSLRKKTNAWKDRVKLYSYCTFLTMKCLRYFIQARVSHGLDLRTNSLDDSREPFFKIMQRGFSDAISAKISESLSSLLNIHEFRSLSTLVSEDNMDEIEELFMPFQLYREALASWGECIPLQYSSPSDRENILRNLIKECVSRAQSLHHFGSFETLSSFPDTEECQLYKLDVLCRRLSVADLLDDLVSRPLCLNPDPGCLVETKVEVINKAASSLFSLLYSSSVKASGVCLRFLRRLNMALCHRCTVRSILWDGLHACSQVDTNDEMLSFSPSAAGSEAIKVCPNPSVALQFDSTKCSDSIAILSSHSDTSNGASAHQRASKVWGTVISSTFFNPKSGMHRWAIRLDRCERGHVFVGVSTAQASMRTYVGGDKYGWGLIGTQALWHDRRKIRGDFGAAFRTGSIIVVTLDSNAGTLSFGTWKETSSSASPFSLDPMFPASPRKVAASGGTLEDWGVAFEGLPLDAKLYPAVGLYQRDDRVTLLSVESGQSGVSNVAMAGDFFTTGMGYFPQPGHLLQQEDGGNLSVNMLKIMNHNSALSWDSIDFVEHVLQRSIEGIESGDLSQRDLSLHTMLPSISAAMCLFPASLPVLSARFAAHLLPRITECIKALDILIERHNRLYPRVLREGKWVIRATGSFNNARSNEVEEYVVDFKNKLEKDGECLGFLGNGVGTTGKSKNGLVSIAGTITGSSIKFVEDWTDGVQERMIEETSSACFISARLSLDGYKFEGTYQNLQYGTSGRIAALCISDGELRKSEESLRTSNLALRCQSLLRIAHGNLATVLGSDTAGDHTFGSTRVKDVQQKAYLQSLLSSSLLRSGPGGATVEVATNALNSLRDMYEGEKRTCSLLRKPGLTSVKEENFSSTSLLDLVTEHDKVLAERSGGNGSLYSLCRDVYNEARIGIIAVLVHHCHLEGELAVGESAALDEVWRASLTLLEDKIRVALSCNDENSLSMKEKSTQRCHQIITASNFLISVEANQDTPFYMPDTLRLVTLFYSQVKNCDDLSFFRDEFDISARRACLRLLAIRASMELLPAKDLPSSIAFECASLALPQFLGQCCNTELQVLSLSNEEDGLDAGRHYLSNTPGAGYVMNQSIKKCVQDLLSKIGCITDSLTSHNSLIEHESALLSVLPILASSLQPDDIESLVLNSPVLDSISTILSQHRSTLKTKCLDPPASEMDEIFLLSRMRQIVNDDLSRMVLRVALAVLNVITYQATYWTEKTKRAGDQRHAKMSSALSRCIKLVVEEFTDVVPILESKLQEDMDLHLENEEAILYKKWLKITVPEAYEYINKKSNGGKSGQSGLKQMISRGTFTTTTVSSTTNSKPKSNTPSLVEGSSTFSLDQENTSIPYDITCSQHLSRCLDILNCVVRSDEAVTTIVEQDYYIERLFRSLGISLDEYQNKAENDVVEANQGASKIPARLRARIIRFLPMMLSRSQANEKTVKAFFMLIGKSSRYEAVSFNEDEALVASEAISGLRLLYLPSSPGWREIIEKVLVENAPTSTSMASSNVLTVGVLAFIAGTPRALRPGCLVLLKPVAATPLSPGAQSTPNSKSHGSASGPSNTAGITSHHIVGNGTEGIISGLCRLDASAGVVSSIDLKSGMCEVILIDRELEQKRSSSWHKSSGSLTVRALRSPLAEVAQAEQIPLVIPSSFPAARFLIGALSFGLNFFENSLCNKSNDTLEQLQINAVQVSILALRASIVLLSDERILPQFLEGDDYKEVFPALLCLASIGRDATHQLTETLKSESLASLPMHEGKYFHFLQMLAELQARNTAVRSHSKWNERHEDLCMYKKEEKTEDDDKQKVTPERADSGISETSDIHVESSSIREDGASNSSGNTMPSRRIVSQSSIGTNGTDDDDESEAAATAAAHLREAAIAQMAELGLPRSWSELALRRTGGTNIEAAVHFCLERGGEMERLLAEERERERVTQRQSTGEPPRRRGNRGDSSSSNHLIRQLLEMGFPSRWCTEALAATRNNVDEALTWILTNGERLSAEDEGMEDDDDEDDDEEDDDEEDEDDDEEDEDEDTEFDRETLNNEPPALLSREMDLSSSTALQAEENTAKECGEKVPNEDEHKAWSGSVTPVRFISGRSLINPETLSVSGLPSGGFSSVGTKGVLLTSGKWYYEAILDTAGCLQIGWADGSFSGHCHAERGDGCGDGPSSWAFDGWRRYRWHATATEWGCRWKEGDVIGCLVDMDEKIVSFTLNGKGEEIGMGEAFSGNGFRPCGGVYACVSFNRKEKLRLILGGEGNEPFKYTPPDGYRGVGEAVLESVKEREMLLEKEHVSDDAIPKDVKSESRFLCDFSDGEHGHELFAWQHRYYGSDASVHLGSARSSKQSSGNKGSGGSNLLVDSSPLSCIVRELEKRWEGDDVDFEQVEKDPSLSRTEIVNTLNTLTGQIAQQALDEGLALGILFSKKLILHLVITFGSDFDLNHFVMNDELESARSFWRVIDTCVSLRSAGWVGEAGAMAIAAEALGLGISSTEHQSKSQVSGRPGLSCVQSGNETALIPVGGISQLLSTIVILEGDDVDCSRKTWSSLAACAEASIGASGGGGLLVFLQRGLQSAACRSESLRSVLVAIIRRSVRLLAVVDYAGDDSSSSDNLEEDDLDMSNANLKRQGNAKDTDDKSKIHQPDARLTCFLTGLLLSRPVQKCLSDKTQLYQNLFEAWSIGLLSASAPWRMVCALTVSGILNESPHSFTPVGSYLPVMKNYFERLQNTVLRRVWAERAAVPICSRYVQAQIELLASVRRSSLLTMSANNLLVDAATPLPSCALEKEAVAIENNVSWEWEEGWVESDAGWEVWVGSVECMAVDWKTPSRSAVRTLMDGGEGPPLLREGCQVLRGLDWDDSRSGSITGDEDGKKKYEAEKAEREKEKKALAQQAADDPAEPEVEAGDASNDEQSDSAAAENENVSSLPSTDKEKKEISKKKKKVKLPNPKLPVGTVISIEPWNGIAAMARRVRWNLTGDEGVYRYGGDGGRFDICHVELNEKGTRVRKRHPLPESSEQCASRHGFGSGKKHNVLLRIRRKENNTGKEDENEREYDGILEWSDFGAGVRVTCIEFSDGAVLLKEKELLFGSKDSGWEARFGQPSYIPGTEIILSPTGSTKRKDMAELDTKSSFLSLYQELLGSTSYVAERLRNRSDGSKVRVTLEMRMLRALPIEFGTKIPQSLEQTARPPPPICFDRDYHASSMSLSRDGRTLTCVSPDGRGTAFASVGFTKGVHYWEVKLEQADIGSVFIGVAEKPSGSGSSSGGSFSHDSHPRLNRWLGWGFVNFRATYTSGAERVYGAHCHNEDTVGVLLDCDSGRLSFFYDGLKYGEHILNDLGCAFENVSPFGFNADGCGSGGAGQGAPSGIEGGRGGRYPAHGVVRPRALWPVIGLRNPGDRVTLSTKWSTCSGIDGSVVLKNVLATDELVAGYCGSGRESFADSASPFPDWFVKEAFDDYCRWHSGRWYRTSTRASGSHRLATFGLDVELDCSPIACATACAALGLQHALLAGDRVVVKRSAGRPLELAEEAVVLGAYQCRLYYRIVAQKSEGGSLTEGGGRAWFWDESEVVGDSLQVVNKTTVHDIELPLIDRFRCLSTGGLKIVYERGSVVRSDLEIFDRSENIGSIPADSIIPCEDVLERRVNSLGVIRYRVRYEDIGEGWISSRIRGGNEEAIVEVLHDDSNPDQKSYYRSPEEAAMVWFKQLKEKCPEFCGTEGAEALKIGDFDEFRGLINEGVLPGKSLLSSDSIVCALVNAITDYSNEGKAVECSFGDTESAINYAIASAKEQKVAVSSGSTGVNQAAASVLIIANAQFSSKKALLARIALLRAFNRRVRRSLPWLSVRPSQEGTAIMGGLCGQGASVDRAGRCRLTESLQMWVQVPSIASRIRSLRGLIFSSVKSEFLDSVIHVTTTPTPLSHDEYELPREIRTVRVNRLRARRAMAGNDAGMKLKYSVFSQLQSETRNWGGAALRRGFVAKGHGGQKRAFKIKLIGEGVNDYSGPYREVFTDALHEVLEYVQDGRGALGVLDPTPNNSNQIGEERELFMFARGEREAEMTKIIGLSPEEIRIRDSFSSLTMTRDERSREIEESLVFLGRLVGTACRHGIPVDLPLPLALVWKSIAEEECKVDDTVAEMDILASKHPEQGEGLSLLWWQQRMLNSFVDGMSHLLPVELLPILSADELRAMLCGNPDVDVDLLKRVVEYEGFTEEDDVIRYFWDALREMSNADRKKFLQFVWARSRLPNKESDFDASFKIQKASGGNDSSLPSASTCFFSLALPEYTSKSILKQKLKFAFENVCTMESDYVTNDAEVGEGWRGL